MFVGAVADNFNERIEQKIFHCERPHERDDSGELQPHPCRGAADCRRRVAAHPVRPRTATSVAEQVMHHRRKEEKVKYYSTFSSFSLRGMWTGVDGYSPFLNISTNELREIPNESEI